MCKVYIVKYGDAYLHDPRGDESLLTDAKLSGGLNQAGSLVFTMAPNHPLLGTVRERDASSPVEVYDGGVLVFAGYVWELSQDFKNTRTASCKGELAYLGDSLVRPYSTVEGEAKLSAPSSVSGYFQWLIDQHNSRVSEAQRFDVGRNEGALLDKNDRIYRASSQIPTTSEELQSKLLDGPGGYVFVRRENGRRVIDYLADCVDVNAQVIDFGVNLLDYARTDSASSLYTAIRPKGGKPDGSDEDATLESLPDGTYSKDARFRKDGDVVYDAEAVRKYGMIELEWSDSEAATADGLLDSAVIALKEHTSPKTTIEIKAVDMSMFMDGCSPLRPGQLVRVRSKPHGFDSYMLVAKIDPDLNDPSQTVYTLGTTFDAVTGETNKQIRRLNASINAQIDAVAGISAEAKEAAKNAIMANAAAGQAQETAENAKAGADEAQSKANEAKEAAEGALRTSEEAQAAAESAAQSAINAQAEAKAAQAAVDAVETLVTGMQTDVENAQSAADAAWQAAEEADAKATEAKTAADMAKDAVETAKAAAINAKAEAEQANANASAAQTSANEAKTAAQEASSTAAAAKLDAEQAQRDIDALDAELETVSRTMTADYARKTELTEATASLQSQISQNAGQISSTVSRLTEIDETANDAAEQAATAQTAANNAKAAADAAQDAADEAQAAADKAQEDVNALAVRVTKAETSITQNSDAIKLAATKEEVTRTLGGYYTKEQADAAIKVAADGINLTVSEVKETANAAKDAIDGLEVGGRNLVLDSMANDTSNHEYAFDTRNLSVVLEPNTTYTLTVNGRTNDDKTSEDNKYLNVFLYADDWSWNKNISIKERKDTTKSYTFTTPNDTSKIRKVTAYYYPSVDNSGVSSAGTCTVNWYKLERGNKATDWTPAPEDIETRVEGCETAVGAAGIKAENNSTMISSLSTELNVYKGTVEAKFTDERKYVDGRTEVVENWIREGSDGTSSFLELGGTDSNFKSRLTSTELGFYEGNAKVAHIGNKQMHINDADIDTASIDKLTIGKYSFVASSDGHLTLVYTG